MLEKQSWRRMLEYIAYDVQVHQVGNRVELTTSWTYCIYNLMKTRSITDSLGKYLYDAQ